MTRTFIMLVDTAHGADYTEDPLSALSNNLDEVVGWFRGGRMELGNGSTKRVLDYNGNEVGKVGVREYPVTVDHLDHLAGLITEYKALRRRSDEISNGDPAEYEADMGKQEEQFEELAQRVMAVVESMISG